MNKIISIIYIIILFNGCSAQKIQKSIIKIQLNLINKSDSIKFVGRKGVFYSIKFDLINNTDTTLHFWTMSCMWHKNFYFNQDSISIYFPGCDNNYPIIKQILSGEKLSYDGNVRIVGDLKSMKEKEFKLGFILIKRDEFLINPDILEFNVLMDKLNEKRLQNKDIIWSESFNIKE